MHYLPIAQNRREQGDHSNTHDDETTALKSHRGTVRSSGTKKAQREENIYTGIDTFVVTENPYEKKFLAGK